jgi:hypothetical protein
MSVLQTASQPYPTVVELRTTKVSDVFLAVAGSILGLLAFWAAFASIWSPDLSHVARDGPGEVSLVRDAFGLLLIYIGEGVAGFWLLCTGIGGIWRLVDRSPAILADSEGLRFHPSICGRSFTWEQVRYIRNVEGYKTAQIRIGLARRFWSPLAWISSTSVRLNWVVFGLTGRDGRTVVRELKSISQGRLVPRDPSEPGSARLQRHSKGRDA